MKKIKLFLIVFFLIFFVKNNLFAIDTVSIRYFPMHVGDFWVYNYYEFNFPPGTSTNYKVKASVVQSFIRENHIYYLITNHPLGGPYGNTLIRTDSISGSLRRYDSLNSCIFYYKEKLVDSLSAHVGDSTKNCSYSIMKCIAIDTINFFGFSKTRKQFYSYSYFGGGNTSSTIQFIKDFGIYYYLYNGNFSGGFHTQKIITLLGCRINGVVYGDTSLVSVKNISSEIPDRFELYQNYPNPFNPVAIIKYGLPKNCDVSLKVFDVLGKEVAVLVNQRQEAGTYQVDWDGTQYPSGVYYYRIVAGDFVKSKGMILIK